MKIFKKLLYLAISVIISIIIINQVADCQDKQKKNKKDIIINDSICNNRKACYEIEKMFNKIHNFLEFKVLNDSLGFYFINNFMENLTGIKHEFDDDDDDVSLYIGPSKKDYYRWKQWYELKKEFLCWDEDRKKVVLKE